MKFRRLLVVLAVICLFCVAITANASEVTASGTDGGNLSWTLTSDGVLTISGEGEMHSGAQYEWEDYAQGVVEVVVEEGVTSLCDYAFRGLTKLVDVSLPDTLERIGNFAFMNCESLKSAVVPANVSSIGYSAFRNCLRLPAITVDADNTNYYSDEYGVLFNADMTTLLQCPAGFTGSSYAVPEGVTVIEGCAFENCAALVEAFLPDGVTLLVDRVFAGCTKLKTINLPGTLFSTGEWTFDGCTALKNVTICYGVQYVGSNCFRNCTSLEQIVLPSDIDTIFEWAFDGCDALKTVVFTGSAPGCMEEAFSGVTATAYYPANNSDWTEDIRKDYDGDITWVAYSDTGACGDGLIWILDPDGKLIISGEGKMADYADRQWGKYAEQIKYVIIEEGVTSVSESAFADYANLTGVSLPSTLTALGRNAFSYCVNLEKINLPESLETIGVYAFWGCEELSEVYVPESVTSIGYGAFRGCQNLLKIMVDADNMNYCSDEYGVLYSKDMSTLIQCPTGFTGSSYIVPEGVIAIGGTAFEYCASLKEVSLPGGLLEIGQVAFNSCLNLETVNLPGSLDSTGEGTFMECSALKNVTIGEGIRYIESNCFTMCTSLESIIIPGSVDTIDANVFYECTALKTIIFTGEAPELMGFAFDSLAAVAYYPADDATWTEDKLQDYGGDIEWISYSLFDLAGANMSLGNDLTMYLFVNASDVAEGDYYIEIVKTYADGRDDVVKTIPMSEWTPNATMYYVSFDGVAAKEMTDDFYVTVYRADGTQASNTRTISIEAYAIGMLNRTDAAGAATHNLMADMLNYGAAAQQSFKYAQNKLANANMTAAHKACGTQNFSMNQFSNNTVKGTGFMGANLSLESSICMYMYFDQNIVDNTMTARVSYTDLNGKKVSYEIPGSEFFVLAGYGFIGVEITTMAAADAESMVTVEILDGSKVVASGSTSVESVAFNGYTGVPLYVDLMKFCTAAYNFFH